MKNWTSIPRPLPQPRQIDVSTGVALSEIVVGLEEELGRRVRVGVDDQRLVVQAEGARRGGEGYVSIDPPMGCPS